MPPQLRSTFHFSARPLLRRPPPRPRHPRHASTASSAFRKPLGFLLGFSALTFASTTLGATAIHTLLPMTNPVNTLPLPLPGSPEEAAALASVAAALRRNPLYNALAASPEWTEQQDPSSALAMDDAMRRRQLTAGPLRGARKIMVSNTFLHESGREVTALYCLGTALCGFPNVVHGGMLATVMDEAMGRLASRNLGVPAVTARLSVDYKAPTLASSGEAGRESLWPVAGRGDARFVVLKAEVEELGERKAVVRGRLEDGNGKLLLRGSGVFVVPKKWNPRP